MFVIQYSMLDIMFLNFGNGCGKEMASFFFLLFKDKIEIAICLLMFGYFELLGKFRIGLLSKRTWRKSIDTKPKSSTWY